MSAGDIVARVRELEKIRQFITGTGVTLVWMHICHYLSGGNVPLQHRAGADCAGRGAFVYFLNLAIVPIYRRRLNENFMLMQIVRPIL